MGGSSSSSKTKTPLTEKVGKIILLGIPFGQMLRGLTVLCALVLLRASFQTTYIWLVGTRLLLRC